MLSRKTWAAHRRVNDGFSLIEVLVTIAIVGTLAAIAIPVVLSQRSTADDAAQKTDLLSVSGKLENSLTGGAAHLLQQLPFRPRMAPGPPLLQDSHPPLAEP